MSKRKTRISGLLLRVSSAALITCGCSFTSLDSLNAQDKGFSIFDQAKQAESDVDAPVVAAKDAFTDQTAKLPKSQFGSFSQQVAASTAEKSPQLNGPRPAGQYARDGRRMFKQPPTSGGAIVASKLQPFATNGLRAKDRPQPETNAEVESKPAPVVVGDYQKSARRLSPSPVNSAQTQTVNPKVAQVTFQDNGFTSAGRPQGENTASRFGQQAVSRFGGNNSNSTSQPSPKINTQLGQSRSGFLGRSNMQGPPPAMQRQQTPFARNGQSNLQTRQNPNVTAPRVASLQQPTNRNGMSPAAKTPAKSGAKAAKQLLSEWAKDNPELKLPGKQMKLHEFLAKPINGSRKDAINQYWVTFGDMANHKLAIEQAQWLDSIGSPRQQADQAMLKAAQQAAQNRVLHTEIQLARSQSNLGDFLPSFRYKNGKSIPVLPSDTPWVGKLNTKLKEYQKRGIVPARFNTIDDILPKARQLIANRADAVNAASLAAQQAKAAMNNGQAPIANVLEAIRLKVRNEQDFVNNVTGYNRAITDYVLSVRQDINQPKRLAAVLIGSKSVKKTIANTLAKTTAKTTAKAETPEEDLDSVLTKASPAMRQVSTGQKAQQNRSQGLVGTSAYQNKSGGLVTSKNDPSLLKSTGSKSATAKSKQAFDYGPTKESAAAAKFDPAKVQAELPMKNAQPNGPGYDSNSNTTRVGGNATGRTALNPLGNSQQFNRRQSDPQISSTRQPVQNPVGQMGSQPSTYGNQPVSKGFGSNPTGPAGFNGGPSASTSKTFSQGGPEAAGSRPSIPKTNTNPFSSLNATKPDPTSGAKATNRFNNAFGSGQNGSGNGGAAKPDSSASRFNSGGGFSPSIKR